MLIALVAVIEQFSPAFHSWLPAWWPAFGAGLFAITRVLKQHGFDRVPESLPGSRDGGE